MSTSFPNAVKNSKCDQCNLIPMGCEVDDDCPAQYLCQGHYFLLNRKQGQLIGGGPLWKEIYNLPDDQFIKAINLL